MSFTTIGAMNDWLSALYAPSASTPAGPTPATANTATVLASTGTSDTTTGSSAIAQAESDASNSTTSQLLSDLYGGSADASTTQTPSLANIAGESALWHGIDELA
jgi:hypothetical protein